MIWRDCSEIRLNSRLLSLKFGCVARGCPLRPHLDGHPIRRSAHVGDLRRTNGFRIYVLFTFAIDYQAARQSIEALSICAEGLRRPGAQDQGRYPRTCEVLAA